MLLVIVKFLCCCVAGVEPNEFAFATVLTACDGVYGVQYGRQIHCLVVKRGCELHVFVGSSLLDMYAKAGDIDAAMVVFNNLPNRDVVSCTAVIAGCAQSGHDEEALEMFRLLLNDGMTPNYVTYTSVLTAISGLGSLDYGQQIHGKVIRCQMPAYAVLQNSLVDMYAKCGCLSGARKVFDGMPDRTVSSWNVLLVGYGKHGLGRQAIDLFRLMERQVDVKPDGISYMAILSGCSHAGLVDDGIDIFNKMVLSKEVKPDSLHYGCVVDLMGRAGLVDKAFEFIMSMPFEPTAAIWGSLLGACQVHTNVRVGEYVAHRLFEMEPNSSTNYVMLSNVYAAAGRWEDVLRMRKLMKDRNMIKQPGRSWMKINEVMHTFRAGGRSHPRRTEIFAKLEELTERIRESGYAPDLSCILHDVDDEQKEKILLTHSEKLAVAFALIATPEGAIIRIVKNIRICVDCHNFMKFVSMIHAREISVRDTKRFHHIVDGTCSCGDYW